MEPKQIREKIQNGELQTKLKEGMESTVWAF